MSVKPKRPKKLATYRLCRVVTCNEYVTVTGCPSVAAAKRYAEEAPWPCRGRSPDRVTHWTVLTVTQEPPCGS